jgi:hypothetical protein
MNFSRDSKANYSCQQQWKNKMGKRSIAKLITAMKMDFHPEHSLLIDSSICWPVRQSEERRWAGAIKKQLVSMLIAFIDKWEKYKNYIWIIWDIRMIYSFLRWTNWNNIWNVVRRYRLDHYEDFLSQFNKI